VFDLRDGSLLRGPAAYPQPAWETRVQDGRIEVRRR
jgi:nitrite reductase/ring-hydroxylating ferredoxin subunit